MTISEKPLSWVIKFPPSIVESWNPSQNIFQQDISAFAGKLPVRLQVIIVLAGLDLPVLKDK